MDPPNKKSHPPTHITDLPETLIHHIFSYLSLHDTSQLSLSLKSWRNLCYNLPSLTLNIDEQINQHRFSSYLNFIDRLFLLRCEFPLQSLTIFSMLPILHNQFRVETWILHCIKGKIEELHLNLSWQFTPVLIREIFQCSSLKVLKLNLNSHYIPIQAPHVGFANLHCLSLTSVELPEDPFSTWMGTKCSSITTMNLIDCSGFTTLKINCASLETLKICDPQFSKLCHLNISSQKLKTLHVELYSPFQSENSFTLFAPDLQTITWIGRVVDKWNVCILTSMQTATIRVSITELPSNRRGALGRFFWQIIKSLQHVRSLHLCSASMLILALAMLKYKPSPSFEKMEYLKFSSCCTKLETCLVTYMLWRSCNLKTLVITAGTDDLTQRCHLIKEFQEYQNLKFDHGLKRAEIRLVDLGENNLELAKFLLNNAKTLESLTLTYSISDVDLAKKIHRELKDFQRPSTLATIFLVPE